MNIDILLIGLVALTFAAIIVFAVTSRKATEDRMSDNTVRKSSLASDGNRHRRAD